MEATLDLSAFFAQETWDTDTYEGLKKLAFSTTESVYRFRELLSELERKTNDGEGDVSSQALKLGACYLLLSETEKAASWLRKSGETALRSFLLGQALRDMRHFTESAAEFAKAASLGWDSLECRCQEAESLLMNGDREAAAGIIEQVERSGASSSQWHYVRGRLLNEEGDLQGALAALEKALELDDTNPYATFHLAYLLDLHGDDERAVELYSACAEMPYVYAHALINLAVVYDDAEKYGDAERCLRRVLAVCPDHERARLYLRDVLATRDMVIDEQQMALQEKRDAVLDIPVTDFELSVRSRNCLKKMNINTLGDLLKTTEAELLAYKNFGETSLQEIKAMLTQKGLSIGQCSQEKSDSGGPEVPSANPELLNRSVATLGLSVRSRKCLQRLGIETVAELVSKTEAELLGSKNFGQTSLSEVKSRLTELGLSLAQTQA